MVSASDVASYQANGYAVVKGLFSADEAAAYREHYMRLRAEGSKPGDMVADTQKAGDPLKAFPRMIHMHRWDKPSLDFVLSERIRECLAAFLGSEPLAVQTMLYFKPAGARGQALHQDNFYPNTSADRFRRSLIGHYIESRAERVAEFDQPVLRMDGTPFTMEASADGGPCGVWVDRDGKPQIEISDRELVAGGHE